MVSLHRTLLTLWCVYSTICTHWCQWDGGRVLKIRSQAHKSKHKMKGGERRVCSRPWCLRVNVRERYNWRALVWSVRLSYNLRINTSQSSALPTPIVNPQFADPRSAICRCRVWRSAICRCGSANCRQRYAICRSAVCKITRQKLQFSLLLFSLPGLDTFLVYELDSGL